MVTSVLCNNCNLIGLYCNSPKKLDFIHQIVSHKVGWDKIHQIININ